MRPQNVCLVVGLGGSGKTSLIRALTANPEARPEVRTSRFRVFQAPLWRESKGVIGVRKTDKCTLFIADYNGQRFDQFFGSVMELQSQKNSPIRFGTINSLLFVVDLFPSPKMPDEEPETDSDAVDDHLRHTLEFWSNSTMDAIFGLTTQSLKYVCLFINKADLLNKVSVSGSSQTVLDKYREVRTHINKYSEGRHFRTIVGSARTGDGIPVLRSDLITAAYAASSKG